MNLSLMSSLITVTSTGKIDNNDQIYSEMDLSYSLSGGPNKALKYLFKLQNESTDDGKDLSAALILQVSQFPSLSVNTKARCHISSGRFETSGSLNIGQNTFNIETDNVITYSFEDKLKTYDIKSMTTSSTHEIDVLLTEKFQLKRNYLLREAYLRLMPGFEINSKTEMGYYNKEGYASVKLNLPNFDLAQEISYSKVADSYYTAKVRKVILESSS